MGLLDGVVVALGGLAMAAEDRQLVPYHFWLAADVAGIGQAGDGAEGELLAAAGDHHRRSRLLHGLRLEDRVRRLEVPAVESRPFLRPQRQDQPDGLLHLPDADRRSGRKFPAVLTILSLEIAGADAEGKP